MIHILFSPRADAAACLMSYGDQSYVAPQGLAQMGLSDPVRTYRQPKTYKGEGFLLVLRHQHPVPMIVR